MCAAPSDRLKPGLTLITRLQTLIRRRRSLAPGTGTPGPARPRRATRAAPASDVTIKRYQTAAESQSRLDCPGAAPSLAELFDSRLISEPNQSSPPPLLTMACLATAAASSRCCGSLGAWLAGANTQSEPWLTYLINIVDASTVSQCFRVQDRS